MKRKTLNLPIGRIEIHENYLIAEIHEGKSVEVSSSEILEDIAATYFSNKMFVYITVRKNSYSVNPSVYKKTSLIENLAGIAVVANTPLAFNNVEIEKLFSSTPFESFTNIESAVNWAHSLLNQNGKKTNCVNN
ncbi:hypothetical protein [Tamlana crocina]|uniref:STAS/SEC14 domain-containing protein n=1 Tax=Tamlana crocina TaxID=393006 RepID=A0ABX1DC14_9FLAO|nr:hypothetical protein [Tamlana crocina]NJX15612.1 hypothetical protein [Tamlana crocina]